MRENNTLTLDAVKECKQEEYDAMMFKWKQLLEKVNLPGSAIRSAIAHSFDSWMTRNFGDINFHSTQLLSEHGCFGKFLFRIKKAESPMCLYCKDVVEIAEHTLLICPNWKSEREVLLKIIKCRATLNEVVAAIYENRTNWSAFNYAKEVMLAKENLEREMEMEMGEDEGEDLSPPAPTPLPAPDPWPPPRRRKVARLEVIPEDSESE